MFDSLVSKYQTMSSDRVLHRMSARLYLTRFLPISKRRMQVILLLTSGGMLEAYLDYTKRTHILKNYGDELLLITPSVSFKLDMGHMKPSLSRRNAFP